MNPNLRGQLTIADGGSQVSLTSLLSADVALGHQGQNENDVHIPEIIVPSVATKPRECEGYNSGDCWIASDKTIESIENGRKSERRLNYTMPGIMSEDKFGDPVFELARKQFGESYQQRRHLPELDDSLLSLQVLVSDGLLNCALDMTSRMLISIGHGYGKAHQPGTSITQYSFQIWTRRLQILLAVRNHKLAWSEVETFGSLDAADLFWAYYPETFSKMGSFVPFTFRLLHAEIPRFVNNTPEALTRCNKLVSTIKTMVYNLECGSCEDGSGKLEEKFKESSLKLWKSRLLQGRYCMARTLLHMKEYSLACNILEGMAKDHPEDASMILSQAGRVCLQLGHFVSAAEFFQKFNTSCDQSSQSMKALACMHRGFLSIFYGNYLEASQAFAKAMQFDPENADAANNYAVCLLYQGQLEQAQTSLVKRSANNLTEPTCLNLSTLHELSSARSTISKHKLLNQVLIGQGDSFDISCFKL